MKALQIALFIVTAFTTIEAFCADEFVPQDCGTQPQSLALRLQIPEPPSASDAKQEGKADSEEDSQPLSWGCTPGSSPRASLPKSLTESEWDELIELLEKERSLQASEEAAESQEISEEIVIDKESLKEMNTDKKKLSAMNRRMEMRITEIRKKHEARKKKIGSSTPIAEEDWDMEIPVLRLKLAPN